MEKVIYDALIVVMLIVSVLIVVSIFMQPSKQDGAADAFSGGSGELFERRKARGFEAIMQRFTAIMIGLWLVIGFVLVVLSTK
ncbi:MULTISPECIES: preprotein translocase subunit SecG [unclassified Lactococcus]|uniref:preprotein translocase subunit SecG n=1 Tax=unclassified Lactococcus TaxID=2643510 RepID=UPI0011C9976E|nr:MULTISPECIES: preprotein translocase subunit SecG [unclassified Lactococcus]MQW22329.1 preprotein translocase subunit SecG [Lactococcus sp. dk101]TXK45251.1 preprotein translocase subunit SecG [Lactococcus sp. dk310]TXK50970.1 preprotein translocase subunit SecG [Lactococcus sp. dk322]